MRQAHVALLRCQYYLLASLQAASSITLDHQFHAAFAFRDSLRGISPINAHLCVASATTQRSQAELKYTSCVHGKKKHWSARGRETRHPQAIEGNDSAATARRLARSIVRARASATFA